MLIRSATQADLPRLRAIAAESPEAAQWPEAQWAALAGGDPSRLVLVAEAEGRVAGFLVAREVAGEWELENMAVAAGARRQGVGAGLIAELVETAVRRGSRAIHLEVRAANTGARALYERCGFRQSGRRSQYYNRPVDDAILYIRKLGPKSPKND